jgi:integrase
MRAQDIVGFRRSHGELVGELTQYELAQAVKACELLRPSGIALLDAVTTFVADHNKRSASMTFGAAFDAFLALPGRSDDYNASLRHTKARVEELLDCKIVDVTTDDLERALRDLPASTRNLRVNRLRSVFNHAVRKGCLTDNPAERLDLRKIVKDEVAVYHAEDVQKLLQDALANDRELVPFLVVAAFCGLRPEREAFNLEWKDVHLDDAKPEVIVRPELSKTRRRRSVPLSENAVEWLKTYGDRRVGRLCEFSAMTLIRKRAANHKRAGVAVVKDGMRHGFCSAHLAKFGDVTKSLLASGHTDSKIFWQHYYRAMSASEAEAYWSIRPDFVPMF